MHINNCSLTGFGGIIAKNLVANHRLYILQIVDLAFNDFSGELPGKCFTRWEAMMADQNQDESEANHIRFAVLQFPPAYYQDSMTVTSKGQRMELVKILTVFTSIDFSSNHFHAKIPKELFEFKALYALNLSHNALSGQIPSSMGNLKQLESLDLSDNSLEGNIPPELAILSFLSFLNLSYNRLSGTIPTGTQIQSFAETSFIGNKGLCGPPLPTNCSSIISSPTTESSVMGFDLQFISTGVGFGVGAGLVVAPLVFWERGRKWSNDIIEKFLMVVLPMLGLVYTPIDDDEEGDDDDDAEDKNSDLTEEDDCDYPRFRGRYCVICSKLDITKKKVIHDSNCTCYHSSTASNSIRSSDSYSS